MADIPDIKRLISQYHTAAEKLDTALGALPDALVRVRVPRVDGNGTEVWRARVRNVTLDPRQVTIAVRDRTETVDVVDVLEVLSLPEQLGPEPEPEPAPTP